MAPQLHKGIDLKLVDGQMKTMSNLLRIREWNITILYSLNGLK